MATITESICFYLSVIHRKAKFKVQRCSLAAIQYKVKLGNLHRGSVLLPLLCLLGVLGQSLSLFTHRRCDPRLPTAYWSRIAGDSGYIPMALQMFQVSTWAFQSPGMPSPTSSLNSSSDHHFRSGSILETSLFLGQPT